MRVLFLNRVFPPVQGATGDLLGELSQELIEMGHVTTVITSGTSPNHNFSPQGDMLDIQRVAGLPFTRVSNLRRALSYLFLYPAFLLRALWIPSHEVVVTMTDPPLHLMLGPVIKFFKGGKLIHWAQDIYPEVAEELGVLKRNSFCARILRWLSTWALKRHDAVIAIGRCMRKRLIERGIAPEKIVVIPNWAQTTSNSSLLGFRALHGLTGKFVVMYSGNFGLAHSFDALVSAVTELELLSAEVMFVFVGDGPRLPLLKEQLNTRKNVLFLPFQRRENLAESLGAADVHIVSMREQLCGLVVPSKVYGVLAAGRSCIFLGPEKSEVAQMIFERNCGWTISNSCPPGKLAELINSLAKQSNSLSDIGQRAAESQVPNNAKTATARFVEVMKNE